MFWRRRKQVSGIQLDIIQVGDAVDFRVNIKWPNEAHEQLFSEMLDALNRGMLTSAIIQEIDTNESPYAKKLKKLLGRISPNKKNAGDRPVAVVPPDKVARMEVKRLNGEF